MPAVSEKQKKFMDAAAHNPAFAKKAGVPTKVAKDFSEASKGQKFGSGTRPDKQGVNNPNTNHGDKTINNPKTNHGDMALFKRGGKVASKKLFGGKETFKEELKEAQAIKSGKISPMQYAKGEESEKKMPKGGKPFAKGGSVRGCGIAQRGLTKGRMI